MRKQAPESFTRIFRKKVRRIDLLNNTDTETLFQPVPGRQFVLLSAFLKIRQKGTNTDAPNITLTTAGTGGGANVAAVDTLVADGAVQRLAVVGNYVIDYDHPLTITKPDAAGGSTEFKVDVIMQLMEISS